MKTAHLKVTSNNFRCSLSTELVYEKCSKLFLQCREFTKFCHDIATVTTAVECTTMNSTPANTNKTHIKWQHKQ